MQVSHRARSWACTTSLRSVDELGSLALPRVRAVAHSPGPPESVGRLGESLDHLPRSQTETRRALGQTELHAIPRAHPSVAVGVQLMMPLAPSALIAEISIETDTATANC